jgi:hypothetical protein
MKLLVSVAAISAKTAKALAGSTFVKSCHSDLVIDLFLLRVRQNAVGFIKLLELCLRLFVSRV